MWKRTLSNPQRKSMSLLMKMNHPSRMKRFLIKRLIMLFYYAIKCIKLSCKRKRGKNRPQQSSSSSPSKMNRKWKLNSLSPR